MPVVNLPDAGLQQLIVYLSTLVRCPADRPRQLLRLRTHQQLSLLRDSLAPHRLSRM